MTQKINNQKGIAQLFVIAIMAFLVLGIPTATKLVQENQENRSKAAEENIFSCNTLRSVHKNYFDVCKDFDNICFNKLNGEYQGCGNIIESNGGDCTDPNHNTNASTNILCPIDNQKTLSCDTLYAKKQKYFASCAEGKYAGVCFNKQTGEYRGCDNENSCKNATLNSNPDDLLNKIFCLVKENDSGLWTDEAGVCGSANGKTFEVTPTDNLCQKGNLSRIFFDLNTRRYSWRCGNVEKLGNQAVICSATVNGSTGSSKITLGNKEISLGVGQSIKIKATLTPPNQTEKITWTTNMPEFFSVDSNGVVTTLKDGASGNITAMTSNGQGDSLRINTSIFKNKIDAKCGTAHSKEFFTVPQDNLCQQSTVVTGQIKGNKYYWTCSGENGGTSANCEAAIISNKITPPPIKITPTLTQKELGAYLYFSPQNQSHKVGDTFEIIAGINSGTNIIGGVDIAGSFDSSKLELISIKKPLSMVFGNKGDCTNSNNTIPGKFNLTCFVTNSWESMLAEGDLVKLTFKAKSVGLAKIQFVCEKNNNYDSNIMRSDGPNDLVVCDKNINANITITSDSNITNGSCGPLVAKQVISNIDKLKPQLLCKSGKVSNFTKTTDAYWWDCVGINGGTSTGCGFENPDSKKNINGACGSVKFSQLTSNSDKNTPELLCKSGKISDFGKKSPTCLKGNIPCPPSFYSWKCLGSSGGKSVTCTVKQNTTITPTPKPKIPVTSIKIIQPLGKIIKVGQSYNLTYILSPSNSRDTVKWSTSGTGKVKIEKINIKCTSSTNCDNNPGVNYIRITGLSAGRTIIKLITSSSKTATSTLEIKK